MSQGERIYWIDAKIRSGAFPNAESVADRFEVSRRTGYADRDYLKERLRAPIAWNRARRGWYYQNPSYSLPFLALSEREALALRRSLLAAREFLGATDAEALQIVADRLGQHLPASLGANERVRGAMRLSYAVPSALLRDCEQAVDRRHRLRLLYDSANQNALTERTVRPYDLLHWRGEPHLVAYCEMRQAMRQFFLGRVREWELLEPDCAFARDPEFDIDAYLARGFDLRHGEALVDVRVRFTPYQSRWIRERTYHESQQTEEQPDGSLIVTMRVAGTEEVRRWLLSYGAEAEVLEPASLRSEIAETLKKVRRIYAA